MKKRRLMSAIAVIISATIILTACSGGSKEDTTKTKQDFTKKTTDIIKASDPGKLPANAKSRKDTIIVGIDAPDGKFSPLYWESAYDNYVVESMFDGLLDVDADGNPIEGMAKMPDISKDGLTYTFHLKDNAKFTDGTPVTAEDVAFTFTVICDSSYTGQQDAGALGLKGWKEYNKGTAKAVEGIKVKDAKTIEFTLDKPNASALYTFTTKGIGIVSKAYYGKDYKQGNTKPIEDLNQKPMGYGQYKFVAYKPGQEVDLVANDAYLKGAPKVKNLIFKTTTEDNRIQQLTSGETDIDMVTVKPQNIDQLKSAGFLELQLFPTNGYGYIGMNLKDAKFQDKKVRQALTYGLNRKQVLQTVYKGYADVCNEPASKVGWTYADDVNTYDYNTDKANKLLDEAGWKKGADGIREKDGKKFEIHFLATSPNPVNDALIPIAKEDYDKLGIKFVPETMDFNTMTSKVKKGEFEMFFMAWGLTADPDQTGLFGTKGAQNKTFYSNPEIDKILEDGLKEQDKEKRKAIYQKFNKAINEDAPYIFMYQRKDMWAISSRITGIETTPNREFTFSLYKAEIK